MTNNKLQELKAARPVTAKNLTIEVLISQAIQAGIPVDTMERLLAMRRELKQEKAKEDFDKAMAKFQAECPTIVKTKEVRTNTGALAYKYAPIDSIVSQVKDSLRKNGFSYSTNMELLESGVKVSVRVTHQAGHSEVTDMEVPLGTKTNIMSQSQVVAAAQTFAKRYAFCNAFGILTGDEDTDAAPIPTEKPTTHVTPTAPEKMSYEQQKKIYALLTEKGKTKDDLHNYIEAAFKKEHLSELTKFQASTVIEKLNSLPEPEATIDIDEIDEGIKKMTGGEK